MSLAWFKECRAALDTLAAEPLHQRYGIEDATHRRKRLALETLSRRSCLGAFASFESAASRRPRPGHRRPQLRRLQRRSAMDDAEKKIEIVQALAASLIAS